MLCYGLVKLCHINRSGPVFETHCTLCVSAAYAVVRCLSVRLSFWVSVMFVYSVETHLQNFSLFVSHSILHCVPKK